MVSKKCLLVIDGQLGMFNLSLPLYNSDSLLINIQHLIQKARSGNTTLVYLQHCGNENSPFKKGSVGWDIHPTICPAKNDYVIENKYSDSFQDTNLEQELKQLAIDHIVICGLVTEGCVDTTVRRAYSLGYRIELASDCHSTTDSNILTGEQIVKHYNEVLKIFSEVKESKDIMFAA
jgi:nicotinamidase-related amidase